MAAKKMALIPAEMAQFYSNQLHTGGAPGLGQLSSLDQQMKTILENTNIPADMKYTQYYNTLRSYGAFKENMEQQQQQLPSHPVVEKPQSTGLPVAENELIEVVPKAQRRGTQLLLKYVKENPDLTWNQSKELVYKGKRIPHSNIFDLVSDISRNRKQQNPAIGWQEFAEGLASQNIPQDAIGNKQRWAFITRQHMEDLNDVSQFSTPTPRKFSFSDSSDNFATPKSSGKRRKRGRGGSMKWQHI